MPINRAAFFPAARATVFHGSMTQSQVGGLNAILDAWLTFYAGGGEPRWLAYELATATHETAFTMQPVREAYWESEEWRKDNLRYWPFYGRGYVQLTWRANYQAMSQIAGVDLVANPDKALEPEIAAKVMLYGMAHGSFTGVGLAKYITPTTTDYVNARRVINGTDKAAQIAAYAQSFHEALSA